MQGTFISGRLLNISGAIVPCSVIHWYRANALSPPPLLPLANVPGKPSLARATEHLPSEAEGVGKPPKLLLETPTVTFPLQISIPPGAGPGVPASCYDASK